MKAKTFTVLVVVLLVLGGLWFVLLHDKSEKLPGAEPMGKKLLESVAFDQVSVVEIKDRKGHVTISLKDDQWGVEEKYGYPADLAKLRRLVSQLKDLKMGRAFEADKEVLTRLSLLPPDTTEVLLKGAEGKILAHLLIGKVWQGGGEQPFPSGQYIKMKGSDMVYLVGSHFPSIETDPKAWLDKKILSINERDIKEIKAFFQGGKRLLYALEKKSQKDQFLGAGPLKDKTLDKTAINKLARALTNLWMEDVLPPSTSPGSVGINRKAWIQYRLFDGDVYKIFVSSPSSKDSGYFLSFEAEPVNVSKEGWIFQVSQWAHKAFLLDPKKLTQSKQKKKGHGESKAAHRP